MYACMYVYVHAPFRYFICGGNYWPVGAVGARDWHHEVRVVHAQGIQQGFLHEKLQECSTDLLTHASQKVRTEAVGVART